MEILCQNFVNNLTQIKQAIEKADFVAIDAEFTGLSFLSLIKRKKKKKTP
jgi:hypothetical protein